MQRHLNGVKYTSYSAQEEVTYLFLKGYIVVKYRSSSGHIRVSYNDHRDQAVVGGNHTVVMEGVTLWLYRDRALDVKRSLSGNTVQMLLFPLFKNNSIEDKIHN